MEKRSPILTFFIILAIFGILLILYKFTLFFFPRSSSDTKELKQQVEELQEANNKLNEKLKANPSASEKEVDGSEPKLSDSEKEVKELKKENKKLNKKLEDMKTSGDDAYYRSIFFEEAEFPYEMRDKSFEFYSDPSCKDEYLIKEDLTFTGWQDYPIPDLESGEPKYYVSYSNEKGIVFSKPENGQPMFNAIK